MKLLGEKTGRKGHLSISTEVHIFQTLPPLSFTATYPLEVVRSGTVYNSLFQVFEVAPSLYMVELRKSGGDTLEFHHVWFYNVVALFLASML